MLLASMAVATAVFFQDKPQFAFIGGMDSLVVAGKKIASVSHGVPFEINVANASGTVPSVEFDLKPSGADKTFHLSLTSMSITDGRLQGTAEIKNQVGTAIEGVRIDFTRAIETYKAKDDKGNEIQKTRDLTITQKTPLSFGDIADGESNGALPFDASGITFKPETVGISLEGVVSGERYERSIALQAVGVDGEIDTDISGHIYLSDTAGNCVSRVDQDGKNLTQLCKLPDQCKGMAVDKKTGEVAANCGNHATIYFYDKDGNATGKLADDVLQNYSDFQRYDPNGKLWSNESSNYVGFDSAHKPTIRIDKFGDFDPQGGRFDVAADGTMYTVTDDSVLFRKPDGSGGVFAKGTGDKLGQLFGVKSVRIGPDGLIYVVEDGANNVPLSTITVFTPSGDVVRAFGRGAKAAKPDFPDGIYDAQLYRPSDVAFEPSGEILVNVQNQTDNGVRVMVFSPF